MFRLVELAFIALLSFSGFLATKRVSLNNEPCMTRSPLTDFNPAELNYYPLMVSLDKCNGNCYAADGLSSKMCFPSKTKDIKLKYLL